MNDYDQMQIYKCPKCVYQTCQRGHMNRHQNKKNKCYTETENETDQTQIPNTTSTSISDQIQILNINHTTCSDQIPPVFQNITIYSNDSAYIASQLAGHMQPGKYLQTVENGRINYKKLGITTKDCATQTKYPRNSSDAHYAYDDITLTFSMRNDEDYTLKWEPSTIFDIINDIAEQLKNLVFIEYEIKLNNKFLIDNNATHLEKFYNISKYLWIKPIGMTANHDNEALYSNQDNEYCINTGNEMCKQLKLIYDKVLPELTRRRFRFRDEIRYIIKTNRNVSFDMIRLHIFENHLDIVDSTPNLRIIERQDQVVATNLVV